MTDENLYGRNFFRVRRLRYRVKQLKLAAVLFKLWNPYTVYDLGCGIGSLLEGFHLQGCEVSGSEYGYTHAKRYMPKAIRARTYQADATEMIYEQKTAMEAAKKYNLVISMEVAEHIDPAGSQTFCHNLVRLCNSRIFLTAAPQGQKGTGHINCKSKEYWRKVMIDVGAVPDPAETERCIHAINAVGDDLLICSNVMVFSV